MFLARKINRAKWDPTTGLLLSNVRSDAITIDLRTQFDKLSFWKCGTSLTDEEDIQAAAMAIASANPSWGKLDIVWLHVEDFQQDTQIWEWVEGESPIQDLNDRHVHAIQLTYGRLGNLAERIVDAINANQIRRFDKDEIVKLLGQAVNQGRLNIEHLKGNTLTAVEKWCGAG